MRPTDMGPAHARRDGTMAFRPTDAAIWPAYRSEVLTRRPGWPVDDVTPSVPFARTADAPPRHAAPVAWPTEQDAARIPAPLRAERPRKPEPPKRKTVSADMYFDTTPMGRVRHREAVVHVLPETAATGLRKFDLGSVPASVTPPRSWRKAAWFAVGTSAAVVLGLAFASAELMGRPVDKEPMIDALPAVPTGPMTLEQLPNERSSETPTSTSTNTTGRPAPKPTSTQQTRGDRPQDTIIGDTSQDTVPRATSTIGGTSTWTPAPTTAPAPTSPPRRTVGAQPVTPTDPEKMGDLTEAYFSQVTDDPAAAHAMTTGSMAREGEEGIEQRYDGVRRVEVQDITIDRNQAVTKSRVKVVRADGTSTIEERQLTFTWGGDPKITDDSVT